MKLIIGLGNPGKEYKNTRHNLGFMVVDEFKERNNFSEFKSSKKFKSLISKGKFKEKRIVLAKPQTFMNNSGIAVKELTKSFIRKNKINDFKPENLIIIHDDLDLDLGRIKIVKNREAAGHKGVQSIINYLKTKNFIRIRVGIKPKKNILCAQEFVLREFTKTEKKIIKMTIERAVKVIEFLLQNGLERTMNKFN